MQKLFNKILIPIDLNSEAKKLVEKAIEMALQYKCTIHLLHVIPSYNMAYCALVSGGMMLPLNSMDEKVALEIKMNKLCNNIPKELKGTRGACCTILTGNMEEEIINLVQENNFDLILIDRASLFLSSKRIVLNPDKISQATGIPVISIPSEKRPTQLGAIVIPVTNFLPLRKLIYGIYLAQAGNTILKLVAIENKANYMARHYLTKCFSLVRDNCSISMQLETVKSNNVAKAVNSFAGSHATDMIIVNPGSQTKIPGFFARLTGGSLQKYSASIILTVSPV